MSYDQYRPSGFKLLPPVVKNILIISGLFYFATIGVGKAFDIDLSDILGMHYFPAEKFQPYQLVTYMFMHASFSHLLFNMFAFWMFGYVLENVWGSKRFLIYFLVTGLGAALIQMIVYYFQLSSDIEALDAFKLSPSINQFNNLFGTEQIKALGIDTVQRHINSLSDYANLSLQKANILTEQVKALPVYADSLGLQIQTLNAQAATAVHQADSLNAMNIQTTLDYTSKFRVDYLNAPLVVGASGAVFGILLAFGMLFPNTRIYLYFFIPIKAKWFVIIYGVIELVAGISRLPGDNIAHYAHLGGMLFGFILIKVWNKTNKKTLF